MAHSYYSEIHLHLTWHTKTSAPLLTPEVEEMSFAVLREKCAALSGIYLHQLGAIPTHIHVALSIDPTVLISDLIGQLKGYSSHEVNRRLGLGRKVLEWQSGYGVVSFGTKDQPWVCEYVRRQKEHHAAGDVHERLEAITA